MINIIIPCTPNYDRRKIINTVNKSIDMVSQFILLYNSIKTNWHFDYRINLFHNKNINFNVSDLKRLKNLDIDIYSIEPDYHKTPYMLRCNAMTHKLEEIGSHRLLLDCDTVALREPTFDLSCDWQAMYANSVVEERFYNYINATFSYNIDLKNKIKGKLFSMYCAGKDNDIFFPHFNAGAILIKEKLCDEFKRYVIPSYKISHDTKVPDNIKHIGVQYGASFSLIKISNNWKPFEPGFNFLAKEYDVNMFGKDKISLLHYCGKGGYDIAYKHFKKEIDFFRNKK